MSYVIEVYRGKYKAERHLGIYALYVLFFPQLIAGPIERPQHLLSQLSQLKSAVKLQWTNIATGIRLMGWGFFKKLVIADRIAVSVDYVYGNIAHVPGLSIFAAIVFFAVQLYTDFSGYSDIARGSARVLGIDVVKNFESPYFSISIAEFWRRWHISLSSWFRDYLYFPLAYSRKQASRGWLYVCVILTFLVTGLWHGAGWTFVIMGGLHGFYIVMGLITKPLRDKLPKIKILQTLFTLALVSFSWIFFRAPDLATARAFLARLFTGWNISWQMLADQYYAHPFNALGFSRLELIFSLVGICILFGVEYVQQRKPISIVLGRQLLFVRSFIYSSFIMIIIVFGVYTTHQFIYFQF